MVLNPPSFYCNRCLHSLNRKCSVSGRVVECYDYVDGTLWSNRQMLNDPSTVTEHFDVVPKRFSLTLVD